MYNQDFLDNLNVMSFLIGIMNYQENLTQSDKDDLIKSMSSTNEELLNRLEKDIEYQNQLLKEILDILKEMRNERKNDT